VESVESVESVSFLTCNSAADVYKQITLGTSLESRFSRIFKEEALREPRKGSGGAWERLGGSGGALGELCEVLDPIL